MNTAVLRTSQQQAIRNLAELLYVKNGTLPATEPGKKKEAYIVGLTSLPDHKLDSDIVLIDAAGEVFTSQEKTATEARFVFGSAGLIILLDPDGFPKESNAWETRGEGAVPVTAELVDLLADNMATVLADQMKERQLKVVVTVSKADELRFGGPDLSTGLPSNTREFMREENALVREFLVSNGMEALTDAAEQRFGVENVRYARISALGQSPTAHERTNSRRMPKGCWVPIAHILDLQGLLK